MITKFDEVSSKSFDNYTSTDELSEINLFFGINGSGKSALADWIYNYNEEATYTFNTEFVNDNLKVNDNIDGVRLIMGEDIIEREEQIDNINKANYSIEQSNFKLKMRNQEYEERLYNLIDTILQETKENFNSKSVNHKANTKSNPFAAIERWKNDSKIDIAITDNISGEIIERELAELPIKIQTASELFPWLTDNNKDDILNLFAKEVEQLEENMDSKLLNWLSIGLEVHGMHTETERCEFCNQTFDVAVVKERILKKIDTEYKDTLDKLNNFKKKLENSIQKLDKLNNVFTEDELDQFQKVIHKTFDIIKIKKQDTRKTLDLTTFLEKLISIDKKILEKRDQYSKELNKYQSMSNDIEQVIRKRVGEILTKNLEVVELTKKYEKNDNSIRENTRAIDENNQKIAQWSNESSDLEPFMRLVNNHLYKLGLDFNLELSSDNESYFIVHKDENASLQIKDLSEGELRLLGFIYFCHSAFSEMNETESKVVQNLKYVVIDDPITSLDTNNRYYITNMLNEFVKQLVGKSFQHSRQVFILTHSSIDFHNICYGFSKERLKKWNIFKNEEGNSQIKLINSTENKNYSDYYKSVMIELIDFAKISKKKLTNKRNFLSYGNKGRFILESHARTHYNIENTTSSNFLEIKKCYEISDEFDDLTKLMLDIFNSLSHGISISDNYLQSISPIEVQKAVITLINILYAKDAHHIDAIGEGVSNYSEFKKNKIYA